MIRSLLWIQRLVLWLAKKKLIKEYVKLQNRLVRIMQEKKYVWFVFLKAVFFIHVSSYGSGTVSSGTIKIKKDLDDDIEGLDVIVVEDIIDSGNTLSRLIPMLKERKPASLKITTLLDKPDRREVDDVTVDYVGFEIEDKFVVGYGLDYDQSYRDLPYIGVIEQ